MPTVAYAADRPSDFLLFYRTPNWLRRDRGNHVDCEPRTLSPERGLEACCRQYVRPPSWTTSMNNNTHGKKSRFVRVDRDDICAWECSIKPVNTLLCIFVLVKNFIRFVLVIYLSATTSCKTAVLFIRIVKISPLLPGTAVVALHCCSSLTLHLKSNWYFHSSVWWGLSYDCKSIETSCFRLTSVCPFTILV